MEFPRYIRENTKINVGNERSVLMNITSDSKKVYTFNNVVNNFGTFSMPENADCNVIFLTE